MFESKCVLVRVRRGKFFSAFYLLPSTFCLFFPGCSHAPQTAADLQKALPSQYQGEIRLQGETEPHRITLEVHNLNVRDTHHLEFNQVRYQFFTGSNVTAQGDANIRGVISTPDLAVEVDALDAGEGSGDAMKLATFQGGLSKNLEQLDATWTTGFGQNVKLMATGEKKP